MFNRTNALILLIAIAGAVGGFLAGGWLRPGATPHANPHALKIGDAAIPMQRPDIDGKPRSLAEWRGKLVLLNFWASWCGPCRDEMPLLDKTQQRLADQGLQVVGVANDTTAATRDFLAKVPVHYPILVDDPDRGEDLSSLFGNDHAVLPFTVLIGRDGRVVARRAGNFTEATLDAWLSPHL
ncbi:MAG TPA: TlpA disulfide reductase family protein [Rhodanobacteraceae bacterium]